MKQPLLSVVTPTYNCVQFIARSYFCLRNQSFSCWEWIVVDDGSDDCTRSVLSDLASSDSRVSVFTLDKNYGRGYARNFALSKCNADGVVIWDVDDLYLPNRLERVWDAFQKGYDFFCSYALVVDNDLSLKGARHFVSPTFSSGLSFVHPTLAFKSSSVGSVGYDQSLRAGEDLEIMLFLQRKCRGFYANEYLMIYVEDREINLYKTIEMHRSHCISFGRFLRLDYSNFKFFEVFKIYMGIYFKFFILQLMRLAPSLYMLTVKLRYKESIRSSLLSSDHILLFKEFSGVSR